MLKVLEFDFGKSVRTLQYHQNVRTATTEFVYAPISQALLMNFSSPMEIIRDAAWHNDLMAAWSLAVGEQWKDGYTVQSYQPGCPWRHRSILWWNPCIYHCLLCPAALASIQSLKHCAHVCFCMCGRSSKHWALLGLQLIQETTYRKQLH